jgi:hypothetical protein
MSYKILNKGCCANLTNVIESDFQLWVNWLTDTRLTSNLQSVKVDDLHTIESQMNYVEAEVRNGRNFFVARSHAGSPLGVLTLTDFTNSSAHFTVLFGVTSREKPLIPLEATALLVEHAFSTYNLTRLEGGIRANGLKGYVDRLSAIGFLPDGIQVDGWIKGDLIEPTIRFSITESFFYEICSLRNGKLWPSDEYISKILVNFKKLKSNEFNFISDQYFKSITDLNNMHKLLLRSAQKNLI